MDKNKICDKTITEEFKIYEENGSITECNDIDDMINLAKFLLEHGSKELRLVYEGGVSHGKSKCL